MSEQATRGTGRRSAAAAACAWSIVCLGSLAACGPGSPAPAALEAQAVQTADEEECPHDWNQIWTPEENKNIQIFTGGRASVPEYNDCQRFFVPGSSAAPVFTPTVFAIFIGNSSAEVLVKKVGAGRSTVALIRAVEAYAPLGIDGNHRYYCLSVTPQTGLNAVLHAAGPDADCLNPGEELKSLWVHRRQAGPTFGPGSVPGVARWGFDGLPGANAPAGNWVQYAIVPCAGAICYVGPTNRAGTGPDFTPKTPVQILAAISTGLPAGGREREIDGWHDTQFLADPNDPSTPANRLAGSLMPDAALASWTTSDFMKGWIRVAEVAMSGEGYEAKFNFSATPARTYNTIDACVYSGLDPGTGNCERLEGEEWVPLDPSTEAKCAKYDHGVLRWRTRHINAAGTDTTYHCIDLKPFPPNPNLVVPGTTRWKWDARDEKAWFRCPMGCCLIAE